MEEQARNSNPAPLHERLVQKLKDNLLCKNPWLEISGSLGDLGTFVPIAIALTLVNGLDLGTSMIMSGIYNIITGLIYGLPMPVQPMKSIAAVAITEGNHLTVPQIMAAGLSVSMITFALGMTGLIWIMDKIIPLPVVRGIQLAQGLSFAIKAVEYILKNQNFSKGKASGHRAWLGLDGRLLAILVFCIVVLISGVGGKMGSNCCEAGHESEAKEKEKEREEEYLDDEERAQKSFEGSAPSPDQQKHKKLEWIAYLPTALLVLILGIILAFIRNPKIAKNLKFGPSKPDVVKISGRDWMIGFTRGSIPQLPLTLLNSVIAVSKLSRDLFPGKKIVTPARMAVSVGLMNMVGCWIGAMPMCHGAGGLAGQYRFGARSGASVVFLGFLKLGLGILLGNSLVAILDYFPAGILGVLLLFSGVELAMACRDQSSRLDSFVMLTCVAISLAYNLAVGSVSAILLYALLNLRDAHFSHLFKKFTSRPTFRLPPPSPLGVGGGGAEHF